MKHQKSNLPVKWDEELARQAEVAAGMENSTATGQFFSLRGGILSWNDAPLPNNQMAVIILDAILENVYYEGEFDPENMSGPTCFAFGRDEALLTPHKVVVDGKTAQCDMCKSCKWNEWASANKGRGKACRNTRRLALIAAGNINAQTGKFEMFDIGELKNTPIGYLKLPVTSVKGFAGFVKSLAVTAKRPPHGIVTRISVRPDPKSQFKVVFEPMLNVSQELWEEVCRPRHDEAAATIAFPYSISDEPAPEVKKPAHKRKY